MAGQAGHPDLGRGSNLQAFIDACADAALAADISVVISNNPMPQDYSWRTAPAFPPAASTIATFPAARHSTPPWLPKSPGGRSTW